MFPVACCLGCMLLALSSCGEGAEGETQPGLPAVGEVPLQVSASLEGAPVDTRAFVDLKPEGGVIHVIRSNANGYAPAERTYKYTADGGTGSGSWALQDGALPIYVDSREAKLRAYYDPNGLIDASGTTATLTAQPYNDNQLLYYCTSATNTPINCFNQKANFNLKLPYARLKLTLKRDNENYLAGECKITEVSLSYKSGSTSTFYTDRTLDISNGQLTGTATTAYNQSVNIGPLTPGETKTDTYDVLLPPQSVGSGLTITLTIDGIKRAITLPTSQMSSFAAGSQYTISLLILDTFYVTMVGSVLVDGFTYGASFPFNGETID